jgi:hypothetical protein
MILWMSFRSPAAKEPTFFSRRLTAEPNCCRGCPASVAVGMEVSLHPPHRSIRAELPHTVNGLQFPFKSGVGRLPGAFTY